METGLEKKLEHEVLIELRIRASSIPGKDLPANYAEVVCEIFPDYNKQKIRNVKNAIAVDRSVTEILESMSEKFAKLKEELKGEFQKSKPAE